MFMKEKFDNYDKRVQNCIVDRPTDGNFTIYQQQFGKFLI